MRCFVAVLSVVVLSAVPAFAVSPAPDASCADYAEGGVSCHKNGCFICTSGVWVTQPLQIGNSTATCTNAIAGFLRWTGTAMEFCNGTAWTSLVASSAGPTNLTFNDQTGVALNSPITSNTITLTGFTGVLPAACGTGCTSMIRNGTSVGTSASIAAGDTLAITQTSSASNNTATTARVSVGGTTSAPWSVTTMSDPCAIASPTAGTVCADGTVYVGLTPDGNVKMYAQRCDLGMTWNGSACTGTRSTYSWNDGSTKWVTTNYTSLTTGKANTARLVALGTTTSPAPYKAARACAAQTEGGHSDWYLPALNELDLFWTSGGSTSAGVTSLYNSSFDVSGSWYWSSSETSSSGAYVERFRDGMQDEFGSKNYAYIVRCVRR